MPAQKYFLAIVIPEPFYSEVEDLKQDLYRRFGLKGALRCPAHITLHRPFVWQEDKEEKLIRTLNQFQSGRHFELGLQNFSFFAPRVIYIDVIQNPELDNLHQNLLRFAKRELHLFNEADDNRGFHPHLTIASRDLKKPLFHELQAEFSGRPYAARFQVTTFCLLKLRKTWEVLKTFPV
ncbi:MAG TPA: 2'-5' RNA ligase family protein [Bacteroidia bacterium]|nr:2'-5' RNA ligase family protein [Bacteroidia bacterium]